MRKSKLQQKQNNAMYEASLLYQLLHISDLLLKEAMADRAKYIKKIYMRIWSRLPHAVAHRALLNRSTYMRTYNQRRREEISKQNKRYYLLNKTKIDARQRIYDERKRRTNNGCKRENIYGAVYNSRVSYN